MMTFFKAAHGRALALAATLAAAFPFAAGSAHACEMAQVGELHLLPGTTRPVIPSEINGQKAYLVADTGSTLTMLLRAQADRLGVHSVQTRGTLVGIGGTSDVREGTIDTLKLDTVPLKNVSVMVAGDTPVAGPNAVSGMIGADLFSKFDVEFDLAHGAIRFFKPKDCKGAEVVYWGGAYSTAPLEAFHVDRPAFKVTVQLNGKPITASLDSGADASIADLAAAERSGVGPKSPGTAPAGTVGGSGKRRDQVWIANFGTFSIGDETIKNAKLRFADLFGDDKQAGPGSRVETRPDGAPEMLLGADFFRAHRVLISAGQQRVYFSYLGGPVFDTAPAAATVTASSAAASSPAVAASPSPVRPTSDLHLARTAAPGAPVRVWAAQLLTPDCAAAGTMTTTVVQPPAHGQVQVSGGLFALAAYPPGNPRAKCNAIASPGNQAVYTPAPGFQGHDAMVLQNAVPDGSVRKIVIDVEVR